MGKGLWMDFTALKIPKGKIDVLECLVKIGTLQIV